MNLQNNLKTLYENIDSAKSQFGRNDDFIQLLAVSKMQSTECILEAWSLGQKSFGENYFQEALPKIQALAHTDIEWHFIGPIQNNKTRKIAEHFSWVHSVEQIKTAERLNNQRPMHLPPLNICIQANLEKAPHKSGALPEEIPALIQVIQSLPRLKLQGFMLIPEPSHDFEHQRKIFAKLRNLLENMNQQFHLSLKTLSMGMSDDYEAAIAEGATIIRVGTALFGARPLKSNQTL